MVTSVSDFGSFDRQQLSAIIFQRFAAIQLERILINEFVGRLVAFFDYSFLRIEIEIANQRHFILCTYLLLLYLCITLNNRYKIKSSKPVPL